MGKEKGSKSKPPTKKPPSATTNNQTPSSAPPPQAPPQWPPFKPALPVAALALTAPAPALADKILVARHFWPRSLCRDYVAFLRGLPLTTTPGRPRRGEALRVNDRFQIDDARFAQRLWAETGLKEVLEDGPFKDLWGGEVVGLNPNIRIYRYGKDQYFDAHYDDSNLVTLPPSTPAAPGISTKTTWTLLLYLTSAAEGCVGGETVFWPHDRKVKKEEIAVALETGMLLLHKHGDDCLLVCPT